MKSKVAVPPPSEPDVETDEIFSGWLSKKTHSMMVRGCGLG